MHPPVRSAVRGVLAVPGLRVLARCGGAAVIDDDRERDRATRRRLEDFELTAWPRAEDEPLRVGAGPRPIAMRWSPPTCNEPQADGSGCGVPAKKSSRGFRCWCHWPDPQ